MIIINSPPTKKAHCEISTKNFQRQIHKNNINKQDF